MLTVAFFSLQASAGFVAAPSFAAGQSPQSVAVGDFNGDGIPDLAVDGVFGSISILLGNGDGTFQPPLSFNAGQGGQFLGLVVADFNGDGHLDIAATTTSVNATPAGVILLVGNGDGTFQAPRSFAVGGAGPLVVGDFNRDGIPDLAVAISNYPNGTVSILLGNGDATFQAAQNFPAGAPTSSVAVGDFNGDGYLDLVVTNQTTDGTVSILLGNGDGTFQAPQSYAVGSLPAAVVAGDFNSDGFLDLAVANTGPISVFPSTPGNSVSILLGHGDGTFQAAQDYATGYGPAAVVIGDFNGDGSLDLAVLNAFPYTVSILLGKGDGTFQVAETYASASGGRFAGSGNPGALALGDFNRDGRPDLAVVGEAVVLEIGTVGILLGRGDGTFQASPSYPVSMAPSAVVVADFNRDGIPDLAVTIPGLGNGDNSTNSNAVSVLLGNGDSTFRAGLSFDAGNQPTSLAVGDFNGDGIPDLAVANGGDAPSPGSTVSILLGNGDGSFQAAQNYAAGYTPLSVAVGDFNRDGNLDVAVSSQWGVTILVGDGHGAFSAAGSYAAGGNPTSLVVSDWNGDGYPDVAVANNIILTGPGTVSVLLNDTHWGGGQ